MKGWAATFVSLLLAAFHLFPSPVSAAALRYEPAVVELAGTVVLEEHFGPPCFGDEPMTDSIELIAVVVLDEPVSVLGDAPNDGFNQTSFATVRRVQLVRRYTDPPFSPYAGKHVV